MPGIAGIIGKKPAEQYRRDVVAMIGVMRHDASYVTSVHVAAECGACVAWTAHPASFASRQSQTTADGLTLALAGECFPADDHGTGGEPNVLQLYREAGRSFVAELNGLFSGLLVDSKRRVVFLFNDRYAAERIYWHETDEAVYFASEAKALLQIRPELRAFDEEGVAQFLAYGSTRHVTTLFQGVSLLPGGSIWTFAPGVPPQRDRYFEPREWEAQDVLGRQTFEEAFIETARTVLPRYATSSSAVGISITGGLDTRMIMACLPRAVGKLVCYTYGGQVGETLDVRIGRRVAHSAGLEHHTLRVPADFVSEFQTHLDRTAFVTDGCLGALGAHEIFLSTEARRLAPIRLTGNFGSEVLRSVTTMKPLALTRGLLNPDFHPRVHRWHSEEGSRHPLTRAAFEEVPMHLFGPMAAARSQLTYRTPFLDNALVKLAYRAPLEARRSTAASLGLIAAGNPALGRIPTDRGYTCGRASPLTLLRRIFCEVTFKLDYFDKEGLPDRLAIFDKVRGPIERVGLLGLHKFLPYRRWFRHELAGLIEDALRRARVTQPYWNPEFLARMGREHSLGRRNYLREIGAVLTLEAIERTMIRGLPQEDGRYDAIRESVA